MRCRPCSGRYHSYIKDHAAAAATTLTIRHSRFAALPLAKLVASLALHPPCSATGRGGLRASSGSLHSPPSPQGEGFGVRAHQHTQGGRLPPHPSRCSLDTFPPRRRLLECALTSIRKAAGFPLIRLAVRSTPSPQGEGFWVCARQHTQGGGFPPHPLRSIAQHLPPKEKALG